jgi:hypothetical protein
MGCPRCGAQNTSGAAFCSVCGSPMIAAQQPPQSWPPQGQPQYPQQPPYGQQPQYPPPQGPQSNKAMISLILGIIGFMFCGIFTTIPGIFLAKAELDAIKSGALPPTNKQLAEIAFWINVAITVLWVLVICIFFAFFGGLGVLGGLAGAMG